MNVPIKKAPWENISVEKTTEQLLEENNLKIQKLSERKKWLLEDIDNNWESSYKLNLLKNLNNKLSKTKRVSETLYMKKTNPDYVDSVDKKNKEVLEDFWKDKKETFETRLASALLSTETKNLSDVDIVSVFEKYVKEFGEAISLTKNNKKRLVETMSKDEKNPRYIELLKILNKEKNNRKTETEKNTEIKEKTKETSGESIVKSLNETDAFKNGYKWVTFKIEDGNKVILTRKKPFNTTYFTIWKEENKDYYTDEGLKWLVDRKIVEWAKRTETSKKVEGEEEVKIDKETIEQKTSLTEKQEKIKKAINEFSLSKEEIAKKLWITEWADHYMKKTEFLNKIVWDWLNSVSFINIWFDKTSFSKDTPTQVKNILRVSVEPKNTVKTDLAFWEHEVISLVLDESQLSWDKENLETEILAQIEEKMGDYISLSKEDRKESESQREFKKENKDGILDKINPFDKKKSFDKAMDYINKTSFSKGEISYFIKENNIDVSSELFDKWNEEFRKLWIWSYDIQIKNAELSAYSNNETGLWYAVFSFDIDNDWFDKKYNKNRSINIPLENIGNEEYIKWRILNEIIHAINEKAGIKNESKQETVEYTKTEFKKDKLEVNDKAIDVLDINDKKIGERKIKQYIHKYEVDWKEKKIIVWIPEPLTKERKSEMIKAFTKEINENKTLLESQNVVKQSDLALFVLSNFYSEAEAVENTDNQWEELTSEQVLLTEAEIIANEKAKEDFLEQLKKDTKKATKDISNNIVYQEVDWKHEYIYTQWTKTSKKISVNNIDTTAMQNSLDEAINGFKALDLSEIQNKEYVMSILKDKVIKLSINIAVINKYTDRQSEIKEKIKNSAKSNWIDFSKVETWITDTNEKSYVYTWWPERIELRFSFDNNIAKENLKMIIANSKLSDSYKNFAKFVSEAYYS